jgi:transcriptional regulatory protein LevR
MTVGIFCHIAFMLNRLKKGQLTAPFPGKESFLKKYPGVISHVSRECRNLGIDYGVVIPQDEICYISAFFTRENIMEPSSPFGGMDNRELKTDNGRGLETARMEM